MSVDRPRPALNAWNRPFWDACRERRLTAQRCATTGRFWFPPGPVSPYCGSKDFEWAELSGRGTVWSWGRMHQVYYEGFRDYVPYVVAQIALDEGISMIGNLVGIDHERVRADLPVEVTFEDAGDGLWLPQFQPRA